MALGTLAQGVETEELVPLLRRSAPSWLAQMPQLVDEDELETLQRRTAGVVPERRLREMLDALEALSATAPLVLVLEDLHWSDYATIDLLTAIAHRRQSARLFVLGSYRPVDLIMRDHPLKAIKHELSTHKQCEEIALSFLSPASVGIYLDARFPHHRFPAELAALLQQRTDGNPLFMVNLVDEWVQRSHLVAEDGAWTMNGSLDQLQHDLPPTLRALIEQYVARGSKQEQQVMAAASVMGEEFVVSPLAAALQADPVEVEQQCEELVGRDVLERRGISQWPTGDLVSRYGFRHAMYQHVLYERIPVGQRQQWHRRIAEALEGAYGARAVEVAAELALHFEQGRQDQAAVRYLALAGQNALRRSA